MNGSDDYGTLKIISGEFFYTTRPPSYKRLIHVLEYCIGLTPTDLMPTLDSKDNGHGQNYLFTSDDGIYLEITGNSAFLRWEGESRETIERLVDSIREFFPLKRYPRKRGRGRRSKRYARIF